jgi:hypothetical protein
MDQGWSAFTGAMHWLHAHDVDTILAVLAILFAFIQYRDMRKLANSMSTRFIGQFPSNMAEIVEVVQRKGVNLDILVDIAAYGHYTRPKLFDKYLNALCDKRAAGCQVRMLVYSRDIYRKLAAEQLPKDNFPKEKHSKRMDEFLAFPANRRLDRPEVWESFIDLLQREQTEHLKVLLKSGVQIRRINNLRLVSMWIQDHEDSIFSFQNAVDHEKEVSFRTRDGNLMNALHEVFESAWTSAVPEPVPDEA